MMQVVENKTILDFRARKCVGIFRCFRGITDIVLFFCITLLRGRSGWIAAHFVKSEGEARGNPDGFSVCLAIPETEPPPGLPRRYAPRNDEVGKIAALLRSETRWGRLPHRFAPKNEKTFRVQIVSAFEPETLWVFFSDR
ncbi:MAG: hypothetical protein LBU11_09625 [Zoogloeaceae bacterium]|jgi:hypothetical protein|nr:hypothetical protein [Zoogloeaceae bacterium]